MNISTRTPFCQRRLSLVVSVTALLGWLTACTNVPPSAKSSQSAWTIFTDYAGGFSVLMPMRPQESTIEQPSTDGPPVKRHQFIVDPDPSIELGVIYNDFSISLPNIQTVGSPSFFDIIQEAVLKQLGGRLIRASDGQFASYPMREIRFEVPEKKVLYQIRIIVVKHRMYQLMIASSLNLDVSHEADTLFNSFHLLYDERQ